MPTALANLHTYWASNGPLTAVLPASKLYTGYMPGDKLMPYALITPIASRPTFTTGSPYIEVFTFQIAVYDTSLANVEAIATVIMDQFDFDPITADTISMERNNYLVSGDPEGGAVFQAILEYDWLINRSL